MSLYDLGGTIRTRTPAETLNIIKPYIQEAGISRIANITGLDCLNIPVYTCYRPHSKSLSTSQGKGMTNELALCSAIMEAVEHYYAENVNVYFKASFDKLDKGNAIDPAQLMLGFAKLNDIQGYLFNWSTAKNLFNGHECFVPTDYICMDITNVKPETGIFIRSTTGLASGNTKEEAILHALFEVIERNCLFEFRKLNLQKKKSLLLDVENILDSYLLKLINKLNDNNVSLAIFDITNQFNVPTYHCIISDKSPIRKLGHQSGTGTHLSKKIALCRAITEAAQSRLTHISGARDDMYFINYQYQWGDLNANGSINYEIRDVIDVINKPNDIQINYLLDIFLKKGYKQVICADHTADVNSISVIHTVVPGLCV